MEASAAVRLLEETARAAPVGPAGLTRLHDARALLDEDIARVEASLLDATADGCAPATTAATYLLTSGGKRVRPLCVLLGALACGGITDEARTLAGVAEMIHLATLLHDDVIDDADERRGQPVAGHVFGNAVSVLAGDSLLVHALERTSRVERPETLRELFATLRRLVDGEVIQLRGRTRLDASEETYASILDGKTASLFRWSLRAGARAGGGSEAAIDALGEFGQHLGVAFQLVDDALDYTGEQPHVGKDLNADLREGKVTLPLILAARREPDLYEALERVRAGTALQGERERLMAAGVRAAGEVRERAWAESARARAALEVVASSPARALLEAVAHELVARLS